MKKIFLTGLLFMVSECLFVSGAFAIQTVEHVDLNRFVGTWYEIASYPMFFERGLTNVTATYTQKGDYIEVFNQSLKNGKPNGIKGKAFVVPNTGNSKLKIQFFWPFKSDYWIIGLADDYSWAVISNSEKSTLWILSRTPKMEKKLYDALIKSLTERGFDPAKIVKMVQDK